MFFYGTVVVILNSFLFICAQDMEGFPITDTILALAAVEIQLVDMVSNYT